MRHWDVLRWIGILMSKFGGKFRGRGRESIFTQPDTNEIVRLYDGSENPLGKAYSKSEFTGMLTPYFEVKEIFYHFFPARSLPIPIPKEIHRWLDKNLPFMIFAKLKKKK